MPYPDLTELCSDLIADLYPTASGSERADLILTALDQADGIVTGSSFHLTPSEIRNQLRKQLPKTGCQKGAAELIARARLFRDMCYQWAFNEDIGDLLPLDVDLVVDAAVSEARLQMKEGCWPSGKESRARLRWLLDKAVARRRRAIQAD